MLFAVQWAPRPGGSEDQDERTLSMFTQWEPPEGVAFQGFWDYADGNGGIAIMESSSAAAMLEATAPWAVYLEFTIRPIVSSEESVPIFQAAQQWRRSVS